MSPTLREMGYAWRCISHYGSGHVCESISGHPGAHVCQCGITWERADNKTICQAEGTNPT